MNIINNKKAFFNYKIEEYYEAGIVLMGWEVKAIRAKNVQIKESYIIIRNSELFIIGMHISPLLNTSTHLIIESLRTRKILLNANEIRRLIGKITRYGYTLVPLNLHYKRNNIIKCEVGLAKGKKKFDKREDKKRKEWNLEYNHIKNNYHVFNFKNLKIT